MKKRNKIIIGAGVVVIVLAVAGYGLVSARPWGGPCTGPRLHAGGFHNAAHHRDMADYILWRMDKKAAEMNLTEAQKVKYEAIKENLKKHFAGFQTEHRTMREQFFKEMEKENPDVKLLIGSAKTKINELSGFMNSNLDLLEDFYSSLDSRQKAMINDEIKERMRYHRS